MALALETVRQDYLVLRPAESVPQVRITVDSDPALVKDQLIVVVILVGNMQLVLAMDFLMESKNIKHSKMWHQVQFSNTAFRDVCLH